jgi:predicted component of viral defense system (DUF524 family)
MKMDSHPSGSSDKNLIEIETPLLDFYIKGMSKLSHLTKLKEGDQATYSIRCQDEVIASIDGEVCHQDKVIDEVKVPILFEQTPYQIIIESKSDKSLRFDHDSLIIRSKVTALGKGNKFLCGVINFENEIGETELRVMVEGKEYLKIQLEVYPTKLSYKDDYLQMREDVAKEIYNLAFDFMKKTYFSSALMYKPNPSLTEFFSILSVQFEKLIKSIDLIAKQPHHKLIEAKEIKRYKEGCQMGAKEMGYLNHHPSSIEKLGTAFRPIKYLAINKQMTRDTYENRMLKVMVQNIIKKLAAVKEHYRRLTRTEDSQLVNKIDHYTKRLHIALNTTFLKEVAPLDRMLQVSLVMQMSPTYRQFYKLYLTLLKGLSISTDIYRISNKNIAELYEYWCFIKLNSLLRTKYELITTDFIKVNREGLFVSLKKGRASQVKYKNPVTGEYFTLTYNQKTMASPTGPQKPDNLLVLRKEMQDIDYKYVLDAKYKMNYAKIEDQDIEVPQENDINTMHRYRDAIVYADNKNIYHRPVFGAVILFPGAHEALYQKHKFYKSIEEVNIGGLPFLPSSTKLVEQFLDELIEGTGHSQYTKVPFTSGIETYIKDLNISVKDVLIGPVRSKEQLDGVLKHHIYYVPAQSIKDLNTCFRHVALYESRELKTLQTGGIRYIGKIEEVKKVLRKDLIDLFPTSRNNLEEEYLIYKIVSWQEKKTPIIPHGYGVRRPTYSNEVLLRYAKTLPELYIKDPLEFKLLLQLRRLGESVEIQGESDEKLILKFGGVKVYMNENREIVIQAAARKVIFTEQDLSRCPRTIYKAIKEMLLVSESESMVK